MPLIRKDLKSNIPFSIFLTRFDNDTYQYLETLRGSDTILRSDMASRNLMCLIFTLFCPDYAKETIFWQFLTPYFQLATQDCIHEMIRFNFINSVICLHSPATTFMFASFEKILRAKSLDRDFLAFDKLLSRVENKDELFKSTFRLFPHYIKTTKPSDLIEYEDTYKVFSFVRCGFNCVSYQNCYSSYAEE